MSYPGKFIIQDYLYSVRKKLPQWLQWKEATVKEILDDLEIKILDEARFIAGGNEPSESDIKLAIQQIGPPESIAKMYRRRGTPKFYLTEELFLFYLRTVLFFLVIIGLINLVIALFQIFIKPWWQLIFEALSGVFIGFLIEIIVITALFVFFSMEGFLPEDFGSFPQRLEQFFPLRNLIEFLEESKVLTKESIEEAKIKTEEKFLEARRKMEESMSEAEIKVEQRLAKVEEKMAKFDEKMERKMAVVEARVERKAIKREEELKIKKKKDPVTLGDLIFGAIAGIVFGLILMIQPFFPFDPSIFLEWLTLFGLLIFLSGIFNLARLAIGVRNHTGQQVALVLQTCFNILYVPLFLYLLNNPHIIPIDVITGGLVTTIEGVVYTIYVIVLVIIIIGIFGGMIGNIVKVFKIQNLKRQKV